MFCRIKKKSKSKWSLRYKPKEYDPNWDRILTEQKFTGLGSVVDIDKSLLIDNKLFPEVTDSGFFL